MDRVLAFAPAVAATGSRAGVRGGASIRPDAPPSRRPAAVSGARVAVRMQYYGGTPNPDKVNGVSTAKATPAPAPAKPADSGAPAADAQEFALDADALKESALAVVGDVSARPEYYGKLVVYAISAAITLTVAKAVVGAVEALPVLSDVLELIGLAYCGWFVWRYLLFQENRDELKAEVDALLGKAAGSRSDSGSLGK